jgi:hypothetical protein
MNKRTGLIPFFGFLIVVAAALFAGTGCRRAHQSPVDATAAIPLPTPPAIDAASLDTLLPPDSIRAIDDPQFENVDRIQAMAPDERVIGIEINGDSRAYPLNILSSHEIVNDVVGGEPVAVTWCPLCYSALVFSRTVDGKSLTFGVSGKLLNNTLVMFDRDSGSLWSQLYGGAISGELSGTALTVFPSLLTTWEAWLAQHPQGQVLSKRLTCDQFNCGTYATNPRGSYAVDPYGSYYVSADEGVVNRQIPRDEFSGRSKERVLGVRVNGAARAYPFALLAEQHVINDEIAGVPVLIWFDPESQTGAAFRREVDGRIVTFEVDADDPTLVRDTESSSRWSGASGQGHGPRSRSSRLTPLISTPAFEFGWYDYFPQSDTYGRSS